MGEFRNVFASRKDLVCKAVKVSIRRSPDCKRFTDFGSPPIPIRALLKANWDFVSISLFGKESNKNLVQATIVLMSEFCNTSSLPGHISIGSISAKHNSILACLPPPRSSTRVAVCRSSSQTQARCLLGIHPEYSATTSGSVSSGTPKRGTASRLTGTGSLLPPVYSEALAKGNAEVSLGHHFPPYGRSVGQRGHKVIPRAPFSSLRYAAFGKHAGWLTNGVSRKHAN
ncbi:hypothetical protein TNCV_2442081 [Trichonephila clavipes]|nr:hypothetical protein TNCV_2442081 [Trichonephila clavipes]